MINLEEYEKEKEKAQSYYKTIVVSFCPALKEKIHFNSEGFNHLIYKNKKEGERDKNSQLLRFKLLSLAKNLIELSTTHQEYEEIFENEKVMLFWGIIAIIEKRKIKVVLKKVGNGQIVFWSVIPAWKTSNYRDIKLFHTMEGNPETD
jgi:hypothetical protein